MRSKKDKAHAHKHARHKKEGDNLADHRRNALSKVFHDLLAGSWVQNIVCGLAIGLILLLVAYLLNRSLRGVMFGAGVGITLLFWVIWLTLMEHVAPSGRFTVSPPPKDLDNHPAPTLEPTPTPMNKDDKPNINISNNAPNRGFVGINEGGTVNLGPAPLVPIAFPDQKAELLKTLLAAPTQESIDLVTYDDADSMNLCQKLRYAFGSWKITEMNLVGTSFPPFAPGVTVRYSSEQQSKQADAIVKAFRDVGLPSRKESSSRVRITVEINGRKTDE